MSENASNFAGIIELTPNASDVACIDDTSLGRLLVSLAEHDSLDKDPAAGDCPPPSTRWSKVGDDSLYDGRTSLEADLGQLLEELEREYLQLRDTLG
jgi:hypothetical protein